DNRRIFNYLLGRRTDELGLFCVGALGDVGLSAIPEGALKVGQTGLLVESRFKLLNPDNPSTKLPVAAVGIGACYDYRLRDLNLISDAGVSTSITDLHKWEFLLKVAHHLGQVDIQMPKEKALTSS